MSCDHPPKPCWAFRAGQVLQALVLGALLARGLLRLLNVGGSDLIFRYQGF